MLNVTPPINFNTTGPEVNNLQQALLFFLSKKLIKTYPSPSIPSDHDLDTWSKMIQEEQVTSYYGEGTRQIVLHFQVQQSLGDNFRGMVVEETTAARMNELLMSLGAFDPVVQNLVKGYIKTPDSISIMGLKVLAYDKDLRREQWLGEGFTNAKGYYEIAYKDESFVRPEKGSADLFVRVFNDVDELLAVSPVVFNAAAIQQIDLALTDQKSKSLWEKLNEELLPLLKGQKQSDTRVAVLFTDLEPSELLTGDIQFLALESGVREETIRKWSLSYVLAKEQNVAVEAFFGWLAKGLPEEPSELWKIPVDKLIETLRQAIADEIIPAYVEDFLEKLKVKLEQLHNDLANAPLIEKIGTLSSAFEGNQNLLDSFTKIYLQNKGDWSLIKPILSSDSSLPRQTLNKILYTHSLVNWTNNNPVMVKTFQEDGAMHSLWDVAVNYNKQALSDKIPDSAIPVSDTRETFSNNLYTNLYAQEPTAVLVNLINDPKVPLLNNDIGKMVSEVLVKVPEYNIRKTSVHEVIKNQDAMSPIPQDKITAVAAGLKSLQRVSLISPVPEAVPVLINSNYVSSYSITQLPPEQFISTMLGLGLSHDTLGYIYNEAEKKKAYYEHLLIKVKEAGEVTGIAMIDNTIVGHVSQPDAVDAKVEEVLADNNLSWDLLFGDADFCECGECTSVYSAAAYYVDLLQYLRNNNTDGKIKADPTDISDTPLEALFSRRPDLGHLELSCKNTNTILPYVDLVNEVMEHYIAFKLKSQNFEDYKGFNVKDETSDELLSAPQHTEQEKAYQALQNTLFPSSLPYHQPIDRTRIFLTHLNTSRFEVIGSFTKQNGINVGRATDAEFLGFTEEEYTAVTRQNFAGTADTHQLHEYYGLNPLTNLSQVKNEFLARTGISYSELTQLINTAYINPGLSIPEYQRMLKSLTEDFPDALSVYEDDMGGDNAGLYDANPEFHELLEDYDANVRPQKLADFFSTMRNCIVLQSPDNHCSLNQVALAHLDGSELTTQTNGDYDKMHRFIRLWRKLGFTIAETDKAIMALGSGNVTPGMLHQLVAIKKIINLTAIDSSRLLSLWGDIDAAGENSLYKQLFLTHNLRAMDDIFSGLESVTPPEKMSDHLPAVMAALNLSADDITAMRTHHSTPDELTIGNLSVLYRHRLLCKTLGIRIPSFLKLMAMFGNIFKDADTTLGFLEKWNKIGEFGFNAEQLDFIINGIDLPGKPIMPTDSQIIHFTHQLYRGLDEIENDHANITADESLPADASSQIKLESMEEQATTDLVRLKVSLLFDSSTVEQIITILNAPRAFKVPVPKNLDIDWTTSNILENKVKYDKAAGALTITGALTQAEITAFNNLRTKAIPAVGLTPPVPAQILPIEWTNSLTNIIALQSTQKAEMGVMFQAVLSGIFGNDTQVRDTYCNIDLTAEKKRLAFLQFFLTFLRKELSNRFLVNEIATATALDTPLAQILITEILESGNTNLITRLSSLKSSGFQNVNDAYLIPLTEANYTFGIKNPAIVVKLNEVSISFSGSADSHGVSWATKPEALKAGNVYRLSITPASVNPLSIEDLYWKTALSPSSPIALSQLVSHEAFTTCQSALTALKKTALLINGFRLNAEELKALHLNSNFDSPVEGTGLAVAINFNTLKPAAILRIVDFCTLRNSLPESKTSLVDFWHWVSLGTSPEGELAKKISEVTLWKLSSVGKLISSANFDLHKADFKNEKNLLKLQKALGVASKLQIDIDKLFEWAQTTSDFDTCRDIADSIQNALRAQYNQTDWEKVVKPLNDHLRNNQKNALVSYLLQRPELKTADVEDAEGLFEYFLIDVQMDTCMETSRIKQAISSTQLFIHRAFLGLEASNIPDVLDRNRWKWMERYRVWEANRKVFLYPENWIESNLRDNKSPFFKELEGELLQNDITKENVTDALKNYFYKVDSVSNMEVLGIFFEGERRDDTTWMEGAKLHVFSRTRNAPYMYYYRYLALDEMNWYTWEKMQVDIPSYDVEGTSSHIVGNGCYLIPVVWNGRLFIFFPQFTNKTKPNSGNVGSVEAMAKKDQGLLAPIPYREIKMAYSELKNGKWTPKQLSKACLYDEVDQISSISGYNFTSQILTDSIQITIYGNAGIGYGIGVFKFDGNQLDVTYSLLTQRSYSGAYFHNYFGMYTRQTHPDASRIIIENSAKSTFHWIPNRTAGLWENYPFHLVNAEKYPTIQHPSRVNELFDYNLAIPGNERADAFGELTSVTYHELKRPYSLYNWELFFHTPIMIADALSKAQQFDEAMKWFHYVFNPIAEGEDHNRFWSFRPFREIDSSNTIQQMFYALKGNEPDSSISEWRNNPFKPHVVARNRPAAYMKWVVMKYIDNILAWGDYLFRQDTIESINQATQMYVLAGHILGRKPMMIPKRGEVKSQSYLSLLERWDAFSNAITELEVAAIYQIQPQPTAQSNGNGTATPDIFGSASSLYFCIPKNPKLLGYWDTLADRLFKIRHCQNIEGVFRKLPLFEPPIDPALLVKAAAQGLSISSVINDLNTPLPNYRFYYLMQKALELCGELKSLGGAILSAIEKQDNEAMAVIRARHEGAMNNLVMEIKKLQLDEALKSLENLQQSRKGPESKMKYYLLLAGEDAGKVPASDGDFTELANSIDQPIGESGLRLSKFEKEDLDKSHAAHGFQMGASVVEALSAIFHAIPNAAIKASPMGVGGAVSYGGTNLGNMSNAAAKVIQIVSSQLSFEASNAAKKGGFQRALQERIFQANAAGYELKEIDKNITAHQISISIANQEILNHQKQIENSNEVEEFLKNKYTNEELYAWMRGSLKTLYHQVYNLAYDLAKKAEKTYCFERGISNANFIQSGYFDAGREGLLAGEQLYVGLKQLESAYHEKRGYDYEVTKHVSLKQINPLSILQLRHTGACEFSLPEVLFDMDYPGHFKRRIKSVSISVPCIVGPYTSLNGSLRLMENKFRNSSIAPSANSYPEQTDQHDNRFHSFSIPVTAIAASSGQNDAGMFELNFKDERYLPFEGAGAISKWRFDLPQLRQFNYDTISDVVMHIRYTSAEGGDRLKTAAAASVDTYLTNVSTTSRDEGLFALIDVKRDMPNEWYRLKEPSVKLKISDSCLPYFAKYFSQKTIVQVGFVARLKSPVSNLSIGAWPLVYNAQEKLYYGEATGIDFDSDFSSFVSANTIPSLEDLFIVVKYRDS